MWEIERAVSSYFVGRLNWANLLSLDTKRILTTAILRW
ncbi:hypothetical protein BOX08_gp07 [Pseudoalteromonas phage BS5]|nr:hypothetical protein BOX08_gp07 [Pseudoalteromonas phage BS5]ANY29572.1 hypothetical protein [Pseudoalteromonas phage BS5]